MEKSTTSDEGVNLWGLIYERQHTADNFVEKCFPGLDETERDKKIEELFPKAGGTNDRPQGTVAFRKLFATRCVVCQKEEQDKPCSACKAIYYCSVEHQKQNWQQHKQVCSSLATRYINQTN